MGTRGLYPSSPTSRWLPLRMRCWRRGSIEQPRPMSSIFTPAVVPGSHADRIEDSEAGRSWSGRHAHWAAQLPRDVADLWPFVVALDHDSRMAIFAHCAASTINAVELPRDHRPRALATADRLAEAVSLDMTACWRPTVRTYLGRITKVHILAGVREAVRDEAAERMADMKNQQMAEAAEQLLAGIGWLPNITVVVLL
jgi:ParB family transcriptional regulator, chromosome partitioning protein